MNSEQQHMPLGDITVIDFSRGLAATFTGKMLCDAGAQLLMVEPPQGHPLRQWKYSARMGWSDELKDGETGALFHYLCGNRHSVVADLDTEAGRSKAEHICARANIVVDDFESGSEQDSWLASVKANNPELVRVSVTPWGLGGESVAANDFTLQAEAGTTAFRGYVDRPPLAAGGFVGEFMSGAYGAVAAMTGLMGYEIDGTGATMDVSTFESMVLSMQSCHFMHEQMEPGGLVPRSFNVPSVEPTKDGWVGMCPITPKQWYDICDVIDAPEELRPYITMPLRAEHMDEILPVLHKWSTARTTAECLEEMAAVRVPVVPVGNGQTITEMDHIVERGVFQQNPAGFKQPRPAYRFSRSQVRAAGLGPKLNDFENSWQSLQKSPGVKWKDNSAAANSRKPLAGIRVLDLAAFWAGPIASSTLANLGADVVRVESCQRTDGMRLIGGIYPEGKPYWEYGSVVHAANPGKRGIVVEFSTEQGVKIIREMIKQADVVLENFSPRVMDKHGFSWEEIQKLNPKAIMARMPAFGIDGPWRDRVGFAMSMEQVSGVAWVTGYADRPPMVPRACVDSMGGIQSAYGVLCALRERQTSGIGQRTESPLFEACLGMVAEQAIEYSAYGVLLERSGNRGPRACPQAVFECKSGFDIALSIDTDSQWQALVAALGIDALGNQAYGKFSGRKDAENLIEEALAEYFKEQESDTVLAQLRAVKVPVSPLINARSLAHHPRLHERNFYTRLEHPVVGPLNYPNMAFRMDGEYIDIRTPAPALGQHNSEVLNELGYSAADIAEFENAGVIGNKLAS